MAELSKAGARSSIRQRCQERLGGVSVEQRPQPLDRFSHLRRIAREAEPYVPFPHWPETAARCETDLRPVQRPPLRTQGCLRFRLLGRGRRTRLPGVPPRRGGLQFRHQVGRYGHPAKPPAGHRPVFREAVDRAQPVLWLRLIEKRRRRAVSVDDPAIDFIRRQAIGRAGGRSRARPRSPRPRWSNRSDWRAN